MIATIRGEISEMLGELLVVENGGVGYGLRFVGQNEPALGAEAKFYVYENIREDAHDLFAFLTVHERTLFTQLLKVPSVGPKVAAALLTHVPVESLQNAVVNGDLAVITAVPGVGKRMAEKIVVELKDSFAASSVAPQAGTPQGASSTAVMQALQQLGYGQQEAQEAVAKVSGDGGDEQELLRAALKYLAGT